jgi:hypothetical protein
MIPFLTRREFPAPSLAVFFSLQALDVLTTLIGLRLGAAEASMFVNRLIRLGPLPGLLLAKVFAVLLLMTAVRYHRQRLIVFLNYWFALVVTWNLVMIVRSAARWQSGL